MSERFDVIVIGAGLGGMLTAAILARRGRRVLVLEREAQVGGRLRSYDVDGFVVDAGAYLWPNRHLDAALAAAGATQFRASAIPPTRVMRIFAQGTGGRRLSFPWPGRPESPALLEAAQIALHCDANTFRALARLWDELAALSDDAVAALMHTPLGEALPRYVTDPAVAEAFRRNVMIFGTYDPDAASMGECIGLRRRRGDQPPARPECPGPNPGGGVRALPLALGAAMREAGVDLRLGHAVEQIAVESGQATAVYARGQSPFRHRFEAPVIVSNLPVWQLFDLVSPEHFPTAFVDSAQRFRVVGGTVNAAFAFRALPRLRQTGEPDDFPGWTRLLIGAEHGFGGGMVWTTQHSPANAPAGNHLLQAMRLSPHADVADERRVAAITGAFRGLVDEIYLDAAEKLLWERTWVTRDGSEYLICAAPRSPIRLPGVSGLYTVGESTDVGAVQMDAAALSALRCAEIVMGKG